MSPVGKCWAPFMTEVARAAALIEDIASQEQRLDDIRDRFLERVDDPESSVARAVNWMLGYWFIEASDAAARSRYEAPFAPMLELKGGVFPPYLYALPNSETVVAIWTELAGFVRHPAIKARVSDLLWCIRTGDNRHRHARDAIGSYLSAANVAEADQQGNDGLLDCVLSLGRAFELSLEINAPDLKAGVLSRIEDLLRQELHSEEASARPGVWMRLFTPLVSLEVGERPSDLDELLAGAHALVTDQPDIRLALFQMQERVARGDQSATRKIRRNAVAMLIMVARRQVDGLTRQHWFIEALELARENGVGHRTERRIRRALQQIDLSSFDWQEHAISSEISGDEIEQWIDAIVGDDRLEQALVRFALAGGPPIGERAKTEQTVDELSQRFVLQNLFTRVVADERGYQIRRVDRPEDKRSLDILEHEARNVQIDGSLRQFALDRISERYATEATSLQHFFQTDLIDANQADAFARAFEHFWSDRPDEALLVSLPRIEAVLRTLLDLAGGVIYQPPRNHRPGRVLGMGDVLRGLEELLSHAEADWLRCFRVALTEPVPGLNLRNKHMHGLAEQASKQDAAVVLRLAAVLRLLEVRSR